MLDGGDHHQQDPKCSNALGRRIASSRSCCALAGASFGMPNPIHCRDQELVRPTPYRSLESVRNPGYLLHRRHGDERLTKGSNALRTLLRAATATRSRVYQAMMEGDVVEHSGSSISCGDPNSCQDQVSERSTCYVSKGASPTATMPSGTTYRRTAQSSAALAEESPSSAIKARALPRN